jgi:hypothetical protein
MTATKRDTLDWSDTATWYCFDCGEDAESYVELDGYVRCPNCAAKWGEHHLDTEEWR